MKTCDLHSHSYFSDGSFSPTQLVCLAQEAGLSALALTDHNTTKGLPEFVQAGKEHHLTTVAGCEFSTQNKGKEFHILGLFMPESSWPEIEDYVELMHMAKHNSNRVLIKNLCAGGMDITYDEVIALTDADEFNRSHVARILVKKGYAESIEHAFAKYLKANKGFYVPAKKVGTLATIRFIKANGGVAVWAHPFFSVSEQEVIDFLPQGREAGLDGMETHYTTYSKAEIKRAVELARENDLLCSGGSDFHGAGKPNIQLGAGYGSLQVPYRFYEALKNRIQ